MLLLAAGLAAFGRWGGFALSLPRSRALTLLAGIVRAGLVARGGRLITLQEPPSEETADKYGVTALFFIVTAERGRLARITDMIDAGKLTVGVAATFPLAEGRAAYESGAVRRRHPGKTVLVVQD